jgi:hypothetical protein
LKVQKEKISIGDDDQEGTVIDDCDPGLFEGQIHSDEFAPNECEGSVLDVGSVDHLDSRVIEATVTTRIPVSSDALERIGEHISSHLTKKERALLESCVDDAAFHRIDGKIKWEEIEEKFTQMADNVNVYCRSRKRLRSSSKSFKEVAKKRVEISAARIELSTPLILTSEASDEPQQITSSFAVLEIPPITSHINLNTVAQVAPTSTRTKRTDNLDELERLFVQDFGKKCLTFKQTVDSGKLLDGYLRHFPSFFRDALTLKNCWINYRKSASFKNFLINK